ncbi:DUF4153 domain-containing protein [Hafnia alvei]|uniref:DUF4153 domain-containing protein n=1 Tax=Hafnia alvei TaxID=569 RepID=A0A1C6Z373_HAFAL|nr:DUF4153 domain-containing protein [Hafnia alvei]NLS54758.1 DUF4153 domain-containing protein [Hafnia alvei]SCM53576.1 protein of unknown function (DUF4153) [Hafnia alvei]
MSLLSQHTSQHSAEQKISPSNVPLNTRIVIILVCLIQGGLLYLCNDFNTREWMLAHRSALLYVQALSLSLPLLFVLSVNTLRDKTLWKALLIYTVIFAAMIAWVNWNDVGIRDYGTNILTTYYFSLAAIIFVTLPWLQVRIENPNSPTHYPDLHDSIWKNTITVVLTLLIAGLMWAILSLGAGLFKLIGIDFFYNLFFKHQISAYLANSVVLAIGVLICRTNPKLVITVRKLLSLMVKGLLPLLSFFALIFIFSLPFTGINALTKQWSSATTLLTTMSLLLALLVNAVHLSADNIEKKPYPKVIRYIINGSLLVLPIYAILSTYYLGLRIVQYGWTPDRLWAAVVVGLSLCLSLAYAAAVLRKHALWLHPLGSINKKMMCLIAAILILCNSPIIDPYRISVNDQMQRYTAGKTSPDKLDLAMLRFDTGRRGNNALQALRHDAKFVSDPSRKFKLEKILIQTSRWGSYRDEDKQKPAIFTVELARKNIQLATGVTSPELSWWASLSENTYRGERIDDCYLLAHSCVLTTLDLNADGIQEPILCSFSDPQNPFCQVYAQREGKWTMISKMDFDEYLDKNKRDSTKLKSIILNGQLKTKPKEWSDIQIQDTTIDINYYGFR